MSMTTNKNKKIAMTILGTAFLMALFVAVPMLGVANGPAFTVSTVHDSQSSTGIKRAQDQMGVTSGGWYVKYVIDTAGFGYCVWVGFKNLIYSNGVNVSADQSKLSGTVNPIANNVSINYRKTTIPVTANGGWISWGATEFSLKNVIQRDMLGFMDAAIDANNKMRVFFSNDTIKNGSAPFLNYTATLWDTVTGNVTAVSSHIQSWKAILNDLDKPAGSVAVKGPSGQILFQGTNMHLLWNNGTRVFHQYNNGTITQVESNTFVGECSMALNSTGDLTIAYSSGTTNLGKIIYTQTWSNDTATYGAETPQTTDDIECIQPNVFFDSNDGLHLVWSAQVNTTLVGSHFRYVVQFKDGSTIQNVSMNYMGKLTIPPDSDGEPIIAFSPKGVFFNGELNIFYLDTTDFVSGGGGSAWFSNVIWQNYGATNELRIISTERAYDDITFNIIPTSGDDIIVAYFSQVFLGSSALNLAKLDITLPIVTGPTVLSKDLPQAYSFNFTVVENDIQYVQLLWSSVEIATTPTERSIPIPASGLTPNAHDFRLTVTDEVGNERVVTGTVTFTDPYLVLIILAIVGGAAAVVILIAFYMKNRTKIMKRKLELKMGGKKPVEDTTWGDEGPAEDEGPGADEGSVDLKKDLKKVDM